MAKYGIREICDVVFKAKVNGQKVGNKAFAKGQPVIYFDTLKTSSLEGAATTVYATGGKGNPRLVAWDGERTLTFNMEDALISPMGLAILAGAGLIEVGADKETKTGFYTVATGGKVTIDTTATKAIVDDKEYTPASGVITLDQEVYPVGSTVEVIYEVPASKVNTMIRHITERINITTDGQTSVTLGKAAKKGTDLWYGVVTENGEVPTILTSGKDIVNGATLSNLKNLKSGDVLFVDYYAEETVAGSGTQVDIEPGKFSGSFYIEGSTLWRDTAGADHPVEIVIPNGKVQSNFTFNMANSGDPSTFSFVVDALADYTEFDKTKKVLASMQIMEETI